MRIIMACIGAPRDRAIAAAINEYETRAARYFNFEVVEVPSVNARTGPPDEVRRLEGEALMARIPDRLERFAVTRTGRSITSVEFAERLRDMATYGLPGAAFVIGGAFGLHRSVVDAAHGTLSLSACTYPHDIARLVLAEQIYRAGTIIRGEPYHKGPRT